MPGLLGGIARTAVVAGTATAVSNRVSRRQATKWAEQGQPVYGRPVPVPAQAVAPPQQAYAPPPPLPPPPDPIQQLKDLAALKDQGILTEDEFAAQKAKVLAA